MCFAFLETALDRVPRNVVEWAMRKRGIPEALVTAVMVDVGLHQRSSLSPLLFAIVIDVATNEIKEGTLQEILYMDDSVLIAQTVAEQH